MPRITKLGCYRQGGRWLKGRCVFGKTIKRRPSIRKPPPPKPLPQPQPQKCEYGIKKSGVCKKKPGRKKITPVEKKRVFAEVERKTREQPKIKTRRKISSSQYEPRWWHGVNRTNLMTWWQNRTGLNPDVYDWSSIDSGLTYSEAKDQLMDEFGISEYATKGIDPSRPEYYFSKTDIEAIMSLQEEA